MARPLAHRPGADAAVLPQWIRPQLTQLVDAAPDGEQWLHEIKFDGYRMQARLDRGAVKLLTRTGLDWTHKYPAIAAALSSIDARQVYLDGELCGVGPDGITSFSMIQLASDSGNAAALVFFLFDLLYVDGDDLTARPLIDRKTRLAALLSNMPSSLHYCDHQIGRGREFHKQACQPTSGTGPFSTLRTGRPDYVMLPRGSVGAACPGSAQEGPVRCAATANSLAERRAGGSCVPTWASS